MSSRLFRLLSALYPRSWRDRYAQEVADLCSEFLDAGEIARWRLALNVAFAASAERLRGWHASRRRIVIGSGATLAGVLGILVVVTGGFGSFNAALPSRGPVPVDAYVNGHLDLARVPDFILVTSNAKIVGYAPKADLFRTPTKGVHLGDVGPPAVTPIYGSDLKTLVGHVYPDVGFVPLGSSPLSKACVPITVVSDDQSEAIPCGRIAVNLPDVVGMYTPTGVAKLSGLGFNIQIVNVRSKVVMPGHIVSTLPAAGASVAVRSVITVDISVRA